jgi:hypothetical protein
MPSGTNGLYKLEKTTAAVTLICMQTYTHTPVCVGNMEDDVFKREKTEEALRESKSVLFFLPYDGRSNLKDSLAILLKTGQTLSTVSAQSSRA